MANLLYDRRKVSNVIEVDSADRHSKFATIASRTVPWDNTNC